MTTQSKKPSYVIFGASGGIASALVSQLSQADCRLFLAGRDKQRLQTRANQHGDASYHEVDIRHLASIEDCLDKAVEEHGPLSGVVNTVGSLLLKPAHLTTEEEWHQTLAVNLTSSFYILRAAAQRMMRQDGGSIVLMSSAVASHGMINHEAIAAAKAGVVGLAKSSAATYARYNIRVNCIAPGLTQTPLTQKLTGQEATLKASTALHALGRIGQPDEVARGIAWFLDPAQSWITGQVLAIDGGLSTLQSRVHP